ncbi:hypothetical protein M9H77_21666 [Catharanthus roseus]|uniref:Uncharacterized protein n=1 Tax=Catharanthus roseus TaxID=4058 RepID=A0ACC0AQW8_CATRO|nr:hypothetical protein M9H77_21666 [Catharanthus roseus]
MNFIGNSQHRFRPESLQFIDALLGQVLMDKTASALITTNEGKFFSNGMDVNYLKKCDNKAATASDLNWCLYLYERGIMSVLSAKLPQSVFQAVLTGKRYHGTEAMAAGFVHETYPDKPTLLQEA